MNVRFFRGINNLLLTCSGFANRNVIANRSFEEDRILQNHADILAQYMQGVHPIIYTINTDRPSAFLKFIEAGDQLNERRFASPGEPDQSDLPSSRNMQGNAFEDWRLPVIAKDNVIESDLASQFLWSVVGYLCINHFWGLIQHFLNTFGSRSRTACQV